MIVSFEFVFFHSDFFEFSYLSRLSSKTVSITQPSFTSKYSFEVYFWKNAILGPISLDIEISVPF